MGTFAPLVLTDYTNTPHTFAPKSRDSKGVSTYVQSNGVPIADKKISVSTTSTTTGRSKIVFRLSVPVVQDQTVAGVTRPTVVRTAFCDVTFTVDATSTVAERGDIRAFVVQLLNSSGGLPLVVDELQSIY